MKEDKSYSLSMLVMLLVSIFGLGWLGGRYFTIELAKNEASQLKRAIVENHLCAPQPVKEAEE